MPTTLNRWQLLLVFFVPITLLFGVFSFTMYQFYIDKIFYLDEEFEDASFNPFAQREVGKTEVSNGITEEDWETLSMKEIDEKLVKSGLSVIGDPSDPFYALTPSQVDETLEEQFGETENILFLGDDTTLTTLSNIPYISASRFEETQNNIAMDSFWWIISLFGGLLVLVALLSYILMKVTLGPIEKNINAQKEFIANASHELKTPLALMKSEAEVLLDSGTHNIDEYKEFTEHVVEDINHLNTLSDTLLGFSKETKSEPTKDVEKAVVKLLNRFISRATNEEKIFTYTFPEKSISTQTSKMDLEQLLTIVLDNACKYCSKNDSITVTWKQEGKRVLLEICDTGKGINKDDLPNIFERFYRAKTERNSSGYGLGLSLAKDIVERNGGTITLENNDSGGVRVLVCV